MSHGNNGWQSWPNRLSIAVSFGLASIGIILIICGFTNWFFAFAAIVLSVICGQLMFLIQQRIQPEALPGIVGRSIQMASDIEINEIQNQLSDALLITSRRKDPIFRRLAIQRLHNILHQTQSLSEGTIEYSSTESWRVAYEELLRSPGLHLYRSVSHIESVHYWQDGPGQQSTKLNLELQDSRTVSVERTAIIADHLWPEDSRFPAAPIHSWLDEQHRHGIWVRIVRESSLASEVNLLTDFGIYGNRAVGVQDADPAGRTVRFTLSFEFDRVQRAEEMWNRLAIYSTSYRDLLDPNAGSTYDQP